MFLLHFVANFHSPATPLLFWYLSRRLRFHNFNMEELITIHGFSPKEQCSQDEDFLHLPRNNQKKCVSFFTNGWCSQSVWGFFNIVHFPTFDRAFEVCKSWDRDLRPRQLRAASQGAQLAAVGGGYFAVFGRCFFLYVCVFCLPLGAF